MILLLLAFWLWQAAASKPQPTPKPDMTKCQVNYLPFHWTTKAAPTTEAQTKKYGPPPPIEHQGFTIQGMGKCDFTKTPPAPPKGFEKQKVEVKGPNLAFIELPQPNAQAHAKKP